MLPRLEGLPRIAGRPAPVGLEGVAALRPVSAVVDAGCWLPDVVLPRGPTPLTCLANPPVLTGSVSRFCSEPADARVSSAA